MRNQLMTATILFSGMSFAQTNVYPTSGSAGIGTTTPNAGFQLQVHGTGTYTSPNTQYLDLSGDGGVLETVPGSSQGTTGRIGLTNSTCGATGTDGTILRQSGINSVIQNLEGLSGGKLTLQSNRALITLDGGYSRVIIGNQTSVSGTMGAALNISQKYDNGLSIQTTTSNKYGLQVKVKSNSDNVIQTQGTTATNVFSVKGSGKTQIDNSLIGSTNTAFSINTGATENFSILGNGVLKVKLNSTVLTDKLFTFENYTKKLLELTNDGILRSREIIVDLTAWPDYVFEENYKLMPLSELREYIVTNNHLPNIPSEEEMVKEGLNVAESNKLLMEKIEELTLYIIQLNEEVNLLKEQNQKVNK